MDRRDMGRELVGLLPRLRRFALSLTRSAPEADDLVQAAVERAITRSDQFQDEGRLDSWMFRILKTVWLNTRRSASVRKSESLEGHEDDLVLDGSRAVEASLELGAVRAAFDRLPPEQRAPLLLVCVEGYTYAEAASLLGLPLGTLTSRLVRGRAALVDALSGSGDGTVTILRRKG